MDVFVLHLSAVVEFIWRMKSSECSCWDVLLSHDRYCPNLLILKIVLETRWESRAPSISVAEDGLEMTSPVLNHSAVPIVQALSLAETSHGTWYGTWNQKDAGSLKPQSRITATRNLNVLRSFLLSASYFCSRHPCSCFRSTISCDWRLWSQLCCNDCQQLQSQFVASLWPEWKKHVSQRRLWAASNSKFRHKLI